jgi:predicted branched-subunit amino acid permease
MDENQIKDGIKAVLPIVLGYLLAGILSLLFKGLLPGNWYIITAALAASIAGLTLTLSSLKRKRKHRDQSE